MNLADVIGPVSHELQNIFNGIVLQSAIVARKVPAELHAEVMAFRELALQGSNLLTWLDRHRHRIRPPAEGVNLNAVIRAAVEQLQVEGVEVVDNTSATNIEIVGHEPDVRRLVTLLIRRAGQGNSPVVVEARQEDQSTSFQVLEADSERDADSEHFFALHPLTDDRYDYAVCKAIARRMGVSIAVEKRTEGMLIRLEFKSIHDPD